MENEEREIGKVKIDKEVLGAIAREAAKKVDGIYKISTNIVEGIAQLIRKTPDRGIKVMVGEREVSFELGVIVKYGVNIPEVTHNVQKAIKEEVENMTGLKVKKVDVVVRGVHMESKRGEKE